MRYLRFDSARNAKVNGVNPKKSQGVRCDFAKDKHGTHTMPGRVYWPPMRGQFVRQGLCQAVNRRQTIDKG